MEQAKFWLLVVQGFLNGTCLVFTACKIFKAKITDWYPVTIWGLATSLLVMGIIHGPYVYYSGKRGNKIDPIAATLNTIVFINAAVLFWEFSWGLFLISIEVQERLSQRPHWFQHKFRKALNIQVLFLIVASFTAAAIYQQNTTEYSFLIIQDAFCILSSVFYVWTLANIHAALQKNQILPDHKAMGLFVVVLLFYVATTISYTFVISGSTFGA
jgi:hypothetical protein